MADNEQISQDVKVEETRPVSAENVEVNTQETSTEVKVEQKPAEVKADEKLAKVKTSEQNSAKVDKSKDKKKKSKDKKPSKVAKSLKETSSELKKVTWPTFGTVVKKTGVVLLVTLLFLAVVFGIDRLCSWLIGLIV